MIRVGIVRLGSDIVRISVSDKSTANPVPQMAAEEAWVTGTCALLPPRRHPGRLHRAGGLQREACPLHSCEGGIAELAYMVWEYFTSEGPYSRFTPASPAC